MKKFILIFGFFLLFCGQSFADKHQCQYPEFYELKNVELKRETFRHNGFFIFIDYYEKQNPYNSFHFTNIVNLAKIYWEYPKDLNVDDYWDKEGNTTPYILIELGISISYKTPVPIGANVVIGTCFDRDNSNFNYMDKMTADEYLNILSKVEVAFIPLLARQAGKE